MAHHGPPWIPMAPIGPYWPLLAHIGHYCHLLPPPQDPPGRLRDSPGRLKGSPHPPSPSITHPPQGRIGTPHLLLINHSNRRRPAAAPQGRFGPFRAPGPGPGHPGTSRDPGPHRFPGPRPKPGIAPKPWPGPWPHHAPSGPWAPGLGLPLICLYQIKL